MDLTGKKTPKAQDKEGHTALLRRLALILVFGYVAAVVLFYFLAGEQLHLRQSRGNYELPAADSGTVELVSGSVVEQRFTTEIQRLEQIDIQWGTYYRPNAGIVLAELVDLRSGAVLLSQSFDAAGIQEGGLTTLTAEMPIEGLYQAPLLLRLTADSQSGSAASPLMDTQGREEGWELSLNGAPTAGVLCFALSGTDYIWTGLAREPFRYESGRVFGAPEEEGASPGDDRQPPSEDQTAVRGPAGGERQPRCLCKLYQVTREGIKRDIALLVEQAQDRLMEEEQLVVGWDG